VTADRPRERLAAHGPAALSASELLTVLWGRHAAAESMARYATIHELARADLLELVEVPGVGEARAAQLLAAFELGRRSQVDGTTSRWTIRAPRDVADRLLPEACATVASPSTAAEPRLWAVPDVEIELRPQRPHFPPECHLIHK